MFNFEQIAIDSSFIVINQNMSIAEVKVLLQQHHFVVLENNFSFVLATDDLNIVKDVDDAQVINEWLEQVNFTTSPVCLVEELRTLKLTSSRPVIIKNETGSIEGIVSVHSLVHYLQEETKTLTLYFTTLVETVKDAVTAVDQEGRVICWNEAAEQFYGIRKDMIIGRKTSDFFAHESIMLQRILDEGRSVRQVYHQPTADSHVLISASPIINNGVVIGGVATEQDIARIVYLNEELNAQAPVKLEHEKSFDAIIGSGPVFKRIIELARKLTSVPTPVLLTGEAGSGKELLAQAIHNGARTIEQPAPFYTIHCGALPGSLLEHELFGYQGILVNQIEDTKQGKLELASGGTLVLKEIDKMPIYVQLKLLQYIKTSAFQRIGGNEEIFAHTRIMATSSSSLQSLMEEGLFLEELYYKLKAMEIDIPPLRERMEDIPELVQSFIREFSMQYNKLIPKLDKEVMVALMNYDWPGNIRELRNIIERVVVLGDGVSITLDQLPQGLITEVDYHHPDNEVVVSLKTRLTNDEEHALIDEALRKVYGNKSAAAKLLGISRGTLYNKMKEYGIK